MKIISFITFFGLLAACSGDHIEAKRAGLVREKTRVVGTFGYEDIRPVFQKEEAKD